MPNLLSYAEKYSALIGRVAFAHVTRRQQAINNGTLIGLRALSPNNDASIVAIIYQGTINTTPDELAVYLSESSRSSGAGAAATIPGPPLSVCVVPSDSSLTIFFIQGTDGGSAITNYQYSTDGITYTPLSPAQTSSTLTISGLTNGTVYTVYLQAINAIGVSDPSTSISAAPITNNFNPASISGLILWLDSQNSSNVALTSGKVASWNDSSSANNDFAASGTGTITYDKPSGINGRPALNFTTSTPTSTYLSKTFNITASTDTLTLFMIVNQTNQPTTGNSELFFTRSNFRYFDLFSNTSTGHSGNLSIDIGSETQRDTDVDIITSPPTIAIISVVVTTTNEWIYVNGSTTSVNNTARGTTAPYNSLASALEWAISGASFQGYIGEVIAYPSTLGTSDRQSIEGYLAWKWGLQESLPGAHPFYSTPPVGPVPGAPTLVYILSGNTNAYVYFTAGSGTITNYRYSTDSGTTYANISPVDTVTPVVVPGLTNGQSTSIQLQAYNGAGPSADSNSISITPSNNSVPAAWLLFDPNDSGCYSGTGSTVNNIGTYGAFAGTKTGAVSYIAGAAGASARKVFNFTGGYIGFGRFNFGSSFTISAWVYPSAKASINGILTNGFANANTAGFKFGWNSWQTSNYNLLFEDGDGTVGNWYIPYTVNNVVSLSQWQHLTVIFNQSTRTSVFLVNGLPVNVGSITTATTMSVNQANFNIGAYIGGSYTMNAQLGLLTVFNVPLTASQVLADFNATKSAFGL